MTTPDPYACGFTDGAKAAAERCGAHWLAPWLANLERWRDGLPPTPPGARLPAAQPPRPLDHEADLPTFVAWVFGDQTTIDAGEAFDRARALGSSWRTGRRLLREAVRAGLLIATDRGRQHLLTLATTPPTPPSAASDADPHADHPDAIRRDPAAILPPSASNGGGSFPGGAG